MASDAHTWRGPRMDPRRVYRVMAKARALEERLIKMTRSNDGYFWIGGPGEEAFNVPLGLLIKKGEGPGYDYLHHHYRSSAILIAMGLPMIDAIRQMAQRATDPNSGGRNFVNHFAKREWNVLPGASTIETQYTIAPGTALAQLRYGGDGITIVNGGDAGTSEGDFTTCLNWATRPGRELPLLILVMNNSWGISTSYESIHGDRIIARRAEAFGMRWGTVDGNDPVRSWNKLVEVMAYVRKERKPYCLEAYVSRLHGHSSSSGAARVDEPDGLAMFGKRLVEQEVFKENELQEIKDSYDREALDALAQVRQEPEPESSTLYDHTFAGDTPGWPPLLKRFG